MTDAQLLLPFEPVKPDWSWLPHFEQPDNDNRKLLELQYRYKNGNEKALAELFQLSEIICRKLVNKFVKEHKKLRHIGPEERENKAFDAAAAIVQRYLRRPNWYVRDHYIAVLYHSVQHELLYERKVDKIVDFVDWL